MNELQKTIIGISIFTIFYAFGAFILFEIKELILIFNMIYIISFIVLAIHKYMIIDDSDDMTKYCPPIFFIIFNLFIILIVMPNIGHDFSFHILPIISMYFMVIFNIKSIKKYVNKRAYMYVI